MANVLTVSSVETITTTNINCKVRFWISKEKKTRPNKREDRYIDIRIKPHSTLEQLEASLEEALRNINIEIQQQRRELK